jgi:hypothetical protein
MNALNTSLDVEAVREVQTSPHSAGPAASGAAPRPADWLGFAASPTFAIMALLTGMSGGGPAEMLCAATREVSPLGGMATMYLLMSAFHLAPWLRLLSVQRTGRGL